MHWLRRRTLLLAIRVVCLAASASCVALMTLVQFAFVTGLGAVQFVDAQGRPQFDWINLILPVGLTLPWCIGPGTRHLTGRSALTGLIVGMWFNVLLITMPYLGMYPSFCTLCLGIADRKSVV